MSMRKLTLETFLRERRDSTTEDLCLMLEQVISHADQAAQEAFRLMTADPARARLIISENPDLGVLEGILDLLERPLRPREKPARSH
jgi:hypothetical protein